MTQKPKKLNIDKLTKNIAQAYIIVTAIIKEVIEILSCMPGAFPYTINQGDTLWMIANRYSTTVDAILNANAEIKPNNLFVGQVICIPVQKSGNINSNENCINQRQLALMNKMRELWVQHVAWTRMTIISMVSNAADVSFVTNRLLRNPADFARQLMPLYGREIASEFESLLRSHLEIAARLVKEAIAGNDRAVAEAERQWYANADKIAAFLARINPNWSERKWREMLHEHLALTKAEAVNRIQGNFAEDIRLYDEIENQALQMADYMSEGIIKQFPEQFR